VPSLIARCELLAQQGAESFELPRAASSRPAANLSLVLTARAALGQCGDVPERAARALDLLLQESGAAEGHLFMVGDDDHLELAASRCVQPPSRELLREAAALLHGFREDAEPTRLHTQSVPVTVELGRPRLAGFRTHLLWSVVGGSPTLIGIAAIRGGQTETVIGFHLLQALADGLRRDALAL
jgi:hypothetical protein